MTAPTKEDVKELHGRITEVLVQGAEIKGEMKGVNKRLDEYTRPCPEVVAHLDEHRLRVGKQERFWDGIKSKLLIFTVCGVIIFVCGAVLFALRNGYK